MLNTLARCLMVGASIFFGVEVFAIANIAQAEPATSLLPLQTRTIESAPQSIVLDQVADSMNTQIAADQALLNAPTGISLDSIPILKALVNETGKFDTGVNVRAGMPISVGFDNLMGNGVLMLGTDFSVN